MTRTLKYQGHLLADRDRAHGRGLPACLSQDAYRRIAAVMQRQHPPPSPTPVRFASRLEVAAAGFEPVAGGFYRRGHHIWEMRASGDGGYHLVRKREEREPDFRSARARLPQPGERVGFIRQGCAEQGVVVSVDSDGDMVTVEVATPGHAEPALEEVPSDLVLMEEHDPMAPMVLEAQVDEDEDYLIQVIQRSADRGPEVLLSNDHADLQDIAAAGEDYGVSDLDEMAEGVVGLGRDGLEVHILLPSGGELAGEERREAVQALLGRALRDR